MFFSGLLASPLPYLFFALIYIAGMVPGAVQNLRSGTDTSILQESENKILTEDKLVEIENYLFVDGSNFSFQDCLFADFLIVHKRDLIPLTHALNNHPLIASKNLKHSLFLRPPPVV